MITPGNRDRRPVPGSLAWDVGPGGGLIVLGTRRGMNWAKTKPGCLIAPLDIDPNSVRWPVERVPSDSTHGRCLVVLCEQAKAQEASKLAGALLRDGADVVLCLMLDGGSRRHQREPG